MSTNANINRREFIGLGSMRIAGALAGAISPARAAGAAPHPPYEPPRGFPRFTANPETAQPPPNRRPRRPRSPRSPAASRATSPPSPKNPATASPAPRNA